MFIVPSGDRFVADNEAHASNPDHDFWWDIMQSYDDVPPYEPFRDESQ